MKYSSVLSRSISRSLCGYEVHLTWFGNDTNSSSEGSVLKIANSDSYQVGWHLDLVLEFVEGLVLVRSVLDICLVCAHLDDKWILYGDRSIIGDFDSYSTCRCAAYRGVKDVGT